MDVENRKRIEESLNDIMLEFSINLSLAVFGQLLGVDYGQSASAVYQDAVNALKEAFEVILDEIKSVDGFNELLDGWQLMIEIGMFMGNLKTWLVGVDSSIQDAEDMLALVEEMRGKVDEFHTLLERVAESNSDEVTGLVEPNNLEDE